MKSILICIDWFTPGYKAGGPVSSNANLIAHFAAHYHFKVLTRNTDYTETQPYANLVSNTWTQQEGFEGYYLSKEQLSRKSLKHLITTTPCDLIYINGIYSWFFSVLPLWYALKIGKPVVVGARGMLSPHALGVKGWKKRLFLWSARTLGLYRQVTFHATNDKEATDIRKILGCKTNILVAPNLPRRMPDLPPVHTKKSGDLKLISIARISPEKGTQYALEVLRDLQLATHQTLCLDLYGPIYDAPYWKTCQEIIKSFPPNVRAIHQGSLEPALLPGKMAQAHFLFQPTEGENFGHTILESLQQACPVIISDRTPWRNLPKIEVDAPAGPGVGWDLPLEKPELFREVILQCLAMDQETYDRMSATAFAYAREVSENQEVLEVNRRMLGEVEAEQPGRQC